MSPIVFFVLPGLLLQEMRRLIAVAKMFLIDAAGPDGPARIASFAALGFSLIGIGWLYSRYLPDASR